VAALVWGGGGASNTVVQELPNGFGGLIAVAAL
jgi:hypothetical protein